MRGLTRVDPNRAGAGPAVHRGEPPARLLVLTTSLLTDRMLWYSDFFTETCRHFDVTTWAWGCALREAGSWAAPAVQVEAFPRVGHFPMVPHTYMRRVNEFLWDYRLRPPSRLSHRRHVVDPALPLWVRTAKIPARALAALHLERPFERLVGRLLASYDRSPDAAARLRASPPSLILATGPMRFDEPAVVAAARRLRIPTIAMMTSWDNLSTKRRMLFEYDAYIVWSEQMRRELHHFYPRSRTAPVYVVGAPQFDVFFREEFHQTREQFCVQAGLRPEAPIILYALGSPNLIREHHGALEMARRVVRGDLGDVQLLIRPHPAFDTAREAALLEELRPRVVVQRTGDPSASYRSQSRAQIVEWVNTFRHADVVVNLASTVTVDAAICDRPVVNIDYDPEPGRPNQGLVRDANHLWTHFKPIAESGGVWNVNDADELVAAVAVYLRRPELHRAGRRWIVTYVCGTVDGQAGTRLAEAVVAFARQRGLLVNAEQVCGAAVVGGTARETA